MWKLAAKTGPFCTACQVDITGPENSHFRDLKLSLGHRLDAQKPVPFLEKRRDSDADIFSQTILNQPYPTSLSSIERLDFGYCLKWRDPPDGYSSRLGGLLFARRLHRLGSETTTGQFFRNYCHSSQRLLDRSSLSSANASRKPVLRSFVWSKSPVVFEGCSGEAPHCARAYTAEMRSLRADILRTC